ncbi:exported hypothetical protein [metagenome]|uniref:SDR-like Ig domain-containing protein n=1 Tax=metagenome TaxID=256318 RepID=A0A2P2BYM9_9ZZZZ
MNHALHHPIRVRVTRLLTGAVALVLATLTTLALASPAQADVIDNAITGVTLETTGDLHDNSRVDFSCTWAVPDGSQPGDTFTLQLPPELAWSGATSFALTAPDGVTPVALASVSSSGLVTFTLTDYMLTHASASGDCHFTTRYIATGAGEHVLEFDVGSGVVRVPVTEGTPCQTNCGTKVAKKVGWWVDRDAQDRMQFAIRAPATTGGSTNSITFIDNPGAGYDLDCVTLRSFVSPTTAADGAVIAPFIGAYRAGATPPYAPGQQLVAPAVTCSASGLTLDWTGVPAGMYSEVRIQAVVTDPSLGEYTNSGIVRMNGVDHEVGTIIKHDEPGGGGQGPAIHLEKWSTAEGGPATTDGSDFPGDHDSAPGADLVPGEPTSITFTITNTGDEDLTDLQVTDATTDGPAITAISCDFSPLGGPSSGTTWPAGPFHPGDSFTCTGTVPAMPADDTHSDEATVTGIGAVTGTTVTSHDPWHGHTPPKAEPQLSTTTSTAVARPGVTLHDQVTGRGFESSYSGTGQATLYGPFSRRGDARCTAATAVGTVAFTPRNGTVRTPGIRVSEPGHYTWVARSSADELHRAATHRCGLASESTVVRKTPIVDVPNVESGFSGTLHRAAARTSRVLPARLRFRGIGLDAAVSATRIVRHQMVLPANTQRLAILSRTATPGDAIGTTVIAGHVSNRHNSPGALWSLRKAKVGQVIGYRGGDGITHRYQVTGHRLYRRGQLPRSVFATTGAPRLALITCARIKVSAAGHFHYTRNLVVFAKQL